MENEYKILLVDDEEEVRTTIMKKIDWQRVGFRVIGDAENGRDALEKIETLEPDVVMTDIRMPYMDGLALAEEIRKIRPSTKIIFFSGYDDFEYAKQAISLRITEYILKPVNAEEMMEILERVRGILDEEIEHLRGETVLQERFSKNLSILRENFLGNLVKGNVQQSKMETYIQEYRLPILEREGWVVIKLDTGVIGQNTSPWKEDGMLNVSVRKLLEDKLVEWGEFAIFQRPSGLCAIIAVEKESAVQSILSLLNDMARESRRILQHPIAIGMGKRVTKLEDLESSYNGAREAVSYENMAGDVIYIQDVEPSRGELLRFDEKLETSLNHVLQFGDEETIVTCVENIAQKLGGVEVECSGMQTFVIGILNVILRVVQKYELEEHLIFGKYQDYNGILSQVKTKEDLLDWLKPVCFSLSGCLNTERMGTTRELIRKAQRYIGENYTNSELSLEMLCGHLHMSTPYFSTIFKREVGESYSSYLTGIRLERAVELLQQTDDKTYVIAAKVGYDEANYFSYVFKKRYGVSPNKFRGK
ncbi:response regulator [Chakrabartyella piscis]|uniref:response regulator n=1 Tax=Chakrabartyella piscis TaxID=2918914 RepID=UPI002958C690|nr:response regulator [Chakrabartyella piscis]